jgi:hypothetical protein
MKFNATLPHGLCLHLGMVTIKTHRTFRIHNSNQLNAYGVNSLELAVKLTVIKV